MTTLRDLLDADVRTPTIRLLLDGKRAEAVLRVRVNQVYAGDGIATGAVTLREPPVTPRQGMPIRWEWGFNGLHIAGFTGYVTDLGKPSYPDTWELPIADVLWLAARQEGPIATSPLNDVTANDAIVQILQGAGLTRFNLPTIPRPSGGTWTLGQQTPISWERSTPLAAAQQIAKGAGYWLLADAGGNVRAVAIERRPSDSPGWTFLDGRDFLEDSPPQRNQNGSQVRNQITVRGGPTGVQNAQLFDTYEAEHALYPGVVAEATYDNFLYEDIADVTASAARIAALMNRRPDTVRFGALFNPYLQLGQTIGVRDPYIGITSTKSYFLYALDTEVNFETGQARHQLVGDGGTGSAGFSTIPPPVAVIAVRVLERETLDGGDAITVFEVDGSGSSSPTGEIVSYTWTLNSTPYSGTSGSASTVKATFAVADTEVPFSVSLEVMDTTSKTGTATAEIDPDTDIVGSTREAVHAAGGAAWSYTPDGGATWNDDVRTSQIAAEGAGVWDTAPTTDATAYGALATSSAQVRQTLDGLATASTLLNTAGGTITALHVNARNAARVWRAVGTTVQRSTDGGTTWATRGTAPASVRQILEDPAINNRLFALAGANFITSADGGATWSTFYAGPSGATARWFVRSESGLITWIAYTGTFTGSPLQRVEGGLSAASWTGATTPTEIQALALNDGYDPVSPQLIAVDTDGQVWVGDADAGAMVAGPTLPANGVAQHATASRRAPVVYIADFDSVSVGVTGALRKLLLGQDVLLPWRLGPSGRQYHMVQLAGAARTTTYTLLVGTKGLTPGGIYVKAPGSAWVLTNSGLPSGWDWEAISVNPFSDQEWVIIGRPTGSTADTVTLSSAPYEVEIDGTGKSPFWRTTDGGATYTEYRVTASARAYAIGGAVVLDNRRAIYTSQGEIAVMVEVAETVGGNVFMNIWRAGTQVIHEDVGTRPNAFNSSGTGGDILVTYSNAAGTTAYRGYIAGGASSLTGFTTPSHYANLFRDAGASPAAFTISGTSLLLWSDYRAAGSSTTIATGLTGAINLRALADAVYLKATAGIVQIANPTGTPTVTTVRSGTYSSDMGRSDQGAQQYLVVRTGTTLEVWDGANWAIVAAPSALVDADMYALGIIDEGAV